MIVSGGREHLDGAGLAMLQARRIPESFPVMFQVREKGLAGRDSCRLAESLQPVLAASGSLLLINERPDIAMIAGAAGVHLPEASCPATSIRKRFPDLLTGQSVHSVRAAVEAWKSGVHYLLFGPVFPTPSKERYGPPPGLGALAEACLSVPIPVIAVGGISPEKSAACIEKGAWGVAALSPFLHPDNLEQTLATYRSYLP